VHRPPVVRFAGIAAIAAMTALLSLVLAPAAAAQQPGRFSLGARGVITAADGEPANDIPGAGLFGNYRLSDRWTLGFAVDRTEYDFEEPAKLVGLEQDPAEEAIDALAEATVVSLWLQRDHRRNNRRGNGRTNWFWGGGVGLATVDVPDASGPLAGGGTFDVHTEVDTELIVSLLAGLQRDLGRRWFFEFALRVDQHFADWQIEDRVSGATGSVGNYLAYGGQVGLGFRF
jgi:hypothetical protein